MAVVADRVIVELEAKLDRYDANVRRAEQRFTAATNKITADARRMELQISASTTAIGSRLAGMAGALGAAFSLQQAAALTDSYTRFTNQLKVAGLQGRELAKVQEKLFSIAQKNGVELESLGRLYGGLASLQKDLGTTSTQSTALVKAVAESIRVGGVSAAQASGAILGLNQALAQTRVQSDEYNQILDGARPLLQAAVNGSEKYRGSLAKLKQDIEAGKVSGSDLFRILEGGFPKLAEQASKAQITISQSFQVLSNALSKFIGEADQANGATVAISLGLQALAANLDTVTTALSVLAAVLLGRFVSGLVAASTSSGVFSAALFAMQARAAGAATTIEAVGFAGRAAGASLLGAFGGPVGLAVTALALGIGYLAASSAQAEAASQALSASLNAQAKEFGLAAGAARQANAETNNLTSVERAALVATANLTGEANQLANAWARVAAAAKAAAIEQARAKLDQAKTNRIAADAELEADKRRGTLFGFRVSSAGADPKPELVAKADLAQRVEAAAAANLKEIESRRLVTFTPTTPTVAAPSGPGSKTKKGPKGNKLDPEEAARRFQDDLEQGASELASVQADLIGTLEARRTAERSRIETDRASNERAIKADKNLSEAQRDQLLALNDQIAATKNAVLDAEQREQHAAEFRDTMAAQLVNESDLLDAQAALARSTDERRRISLRLLEIQKEQEKLQLEAVIASRASTEAEKAIARRRLEMLDQLYGTRAEKVEKDNQGPLADYFDKLNRSPGEINDRVEELVVDELESVRSGIHNAINKTLGIKDPLISGLLDILLDEILFKPIAAALSQAGNGGGGGGLFSGILSFGLSLFGGRASGGNVVGGRTYRINEGGNSGRVEGFQPAGSGKIIPLGRMRGVERGGSAFYQTINVDARGVNPEGFAEHIRQVVRADTIKIVGTGMKAVTAGVPARLQQYDRDGR